MFILDGAVVTSPSDLKLLSDCEFAFARTLDLKLGRLEAVPVDDDPMLAMAGRLGDQHEEEQLDRYRESHDTHLVEIARPPAMTRDHLRAAADQTAAALHDPAVTLIFQATFFDDTDPESPSIGFADFLVRQPDGRWRVQDTKLARSVKVTALLQLAAYHAHIARLGADPDDTVDLLLGDGTTSSHDIHDIAPVYAERLARLHAVVRQRLDDDAPAEWGDPTLEIDGRCVVCADEVAATDDVLQVAGLMRSQRTKLAEVGIRTLADLASATTRPDDCAVPERTYRGLQLQARLQHEGADPATGLPRVEVVDATAIGYLPAPDPADLFFDFEGDPLWRAERDGAILWNLDYLFGVVDRDLTFTPYWAHDLDEERQALIDFLAMVSARRAAHPGMHIYHYASYEKTHLLSIAARHGVGEKEVDQLLRDNVLVDLYPVVKRAIRAGVDSYSIKKLEPFYMGDELRTDLDMAVTTAGASVQVYRDAMDHLARGELDDYRRLIEQIADYNEYDCVSTLRLLDWLTTLGAAHGAIPGTTPTEEVGQAPFDESPLAQQLEQRARDLTETGDAAAASAVRLAAASVDFHRREDKSFWWEHFARLTDPPEIWRGQRGVFEIDHVEIESDWQEAHTRSRRTLRLFGTWAPGSSAPSEGGDVFHLYDRPAPFSKPNRHPGSRLDVGATLGPQPEDGAFVRVTEFSPSGEATWHELPMALVPGPPPKTQNLQVAIAEFGTALLDAARRDSPADWPADPAADIIRRLPPRLTSGELAPAADADGVLAALIDSTRRLDRSALAVQGPPGTGKTYVAARLIAALVREGWSVGVVAQSHRVVENVLDELVDGAELDPSVVAKKRANYPAAGQYDRTRYQLIADSAYASFALNQTGGYVLGGTAWDFVNLNRITRKQLDLLVIDEAGQFSLANTIAVSAAAKRLVLLGDPQQLPQVSQGVHPAPADRAALAHLGDGSDTLPAEYGYFLPESRRMHPELSAVVSRLSYSGRLRSHASTADRMLDGIEPGLHAVPVEHEGDATDSPDEADRVVAIASDLIGRDWTCPPDAAPRPLGPADVIVVTPYNAQVECIRAALDAAGLNGVRVGTVDKFQGQEAVVSIVSLTASSASDVPRGMSFLISRNRLNVAISRAQWASYLLYSPRLLDHLPYRADEVAELSRFIELVKPGAR